MCSVYVGVRSLEIPKHGWNRGRAAIEWCAPTVSNPNVEGSDDEEQHQGLELINNVVFASLGTVTRNSAIWQP